VAKMVDFEFDIDLFISLVEAKPVLWDKTDDIYKDRDETKKACREVCICFQDFEALRDVQKNTFGEYCHNLFNTKYCNSYNLLFFNFMYSTVHIFDIWLEATASVRK
jgi:hypothetical protein